jgi:hypothetical protein
MLSPWRSIFQAPDARKRPAMRAGRAGWLLYFVRCSTILAVGWLVKCIGGAIWCVGGLVKCIGGAIWCIGGLVKCVGSTILAVGGLVKCVGGAIWAVGSLVKSVCGLVKSVGGAIPAGSGGTGKIFSHFSAISGAWVELAG